MFLHRSKLQQDTTTNNILKSTYQVKGLESRNSVRSPGDPYLELYIRVDDIVLLTVSEVKQLTDWLSDVGGLSKSLVLVFSLVTYFFSYRIFVGTVLENLFFIKRNP